MDESATGAGEEGTDGLAARALGGASDESGLEAAGQFAQAERVALLAAALRADAGDIESYERLLVASLADSLPSGVIEIDRDRSLGERLAGRPGKVVAIRVHLGEQSLELRAHRGRLEGNVTTNVRGVAISHKAVALDEWTALFAHLLARFAEDNARARAALERLLGL